ncbi:MAG: hypothetical protein ACRC46_08900 [Thermoguttaceae bacterium]
MQSLIVSTFAIVLTVTALPAATFSPDSPVVRDWVAQDARTAPADDAYIAASSARRAERLKTLAAQCPKIVFTKHFDLGGSHYAYTEAQSDAQAERNYVAGSSLCLLEYKDGNYVERTLISDPNGIIRDPAVSFDGKKVVFAWKKSDRLDDYHLYDYDVESGKVRQLTFGLGYADYEPCILPDGDILFVSTRCVQIVDCWWTEVSNIYRCNKNGELIRRISFDQVHSNYPTLLDDGVVVYTRWDYNDRGQIYPQALFQMNSDGTGQTEFYGNNSWFPTTLMHARAIPNAHGKVLAIFSGHHNRQYGKVGIVDTSRGRQENAGTQLVAPIRETTADKIDAWGQQGDRFSHPYPISEREFLASYNPDNAAPHTLQSPFGLYWFDVDGHRELLAFDATISCNQPVPLAERTPPPTRTFVTDPAQEEGVYTMQDVYFGPGLEGVPRGTAKTLRVVALGFRSVGIGHNSNGGPAGGALVSTPVAIGNGTWDTKEVLGDATIYDDGSACFKVPAKTPLYFQVLDENGHCIQTMRSWSTLQPGETFSCIGCHEDKNTTTSPTKATAAMTHGPQDLAPFYGERRPFSFANEIQPILDKHCIKCHNDAEATPPFANAASASRNSENGANITLDKAKTIVPSGQCLISTKSPWSYTTEQPPANWNQIAYFETAASLPVGAGGFGAMPLRALDTPWTTPDLWLWGQVEIAKGERPHHLVLRYFYDEDLSIFVNGKPLFAVKGHNRDYDYRLLSEDECALFVEGTNYIAAHVHQTAGGQGVEFGLYRIKNDEATQKFVAEFFGKKFRKPGEKPVAFSLKGEKVLDAQAKRYWLQSYINLTNAVSPKRSDGNYTGRQTDVVRWINVQESPAMLPPYKAGASASRLLKMFDTKLSGSERTHSDVKLSREELDKIACWIDLLVPQCGTYDELAAWDAGDQNKFAYYEAKKAAMAKLDAASTDSFIASIVDGHAVAPQADSAGDASNPYRNLALKSAGAKASSNSVCRGLPEFADENCIDGDVRNAGHGKDFPSWGPEQDVAGLYWQVDFGREVRVDQVVVTIRADFPHDTFWKECVLELSNGFKQKLTLRKTADRQVFTFPVQRTSSVRLTDFVIDVPGWAALSEVEVFGIE